MNNLNWTVKNFDELSAKEFHDIVFLRESVFVVEQNCVYQDVDGLDPFAIQIFCDDKGELLATARIFPPDAQGKIVIGRICNTLKTRGSGIGRKLVQKCLDYCSENWPGKTIKISAQCYLIKFYESFGFKIHGEEYLEDGIPHITMTIEAN